MAQGIRIRTRMHGRDVDEQHRVSSPLELLFDLTFVVAVAQVASELATFIEEGNGLGGIAPFLMTFFAIWWAWINFTWFASAYDTDDVFYRLLTLVQMGGVLVLAAGVPAAFEHSDFGAVTLGYVIMRLAAVVQWARAWREDPASSGVSKRYVIGVVVVQALWIARFLLLSPELIVLQFSALVVLEVLVPVWAEHGRVLAWHAHHIAERYGLFTIILLGESVSATTLAVQGIVTSRGVSGSLLMVAISGLVLLFAMWWLYFAENAGPGLERRRSRSFLWGYGHCFLFAAVAAVGAALEVAVKGGAHPEIGPVAVGYALAVPVALFLVMLVALHGPIVERLATPPALAIPAAVLVLLAPLAGPVLGVGGEVLLIAFIVAVLTGLGMVVSGRRRDSVTR